jgi:hypothetical protein
VLEVILARRFEPQLDEEGRPAALRSWQDVLAGLTLRGQPVSVVQVRRWLRVHEWAAALWREHAVEAPALAAEQYDKLPALIRRLFDDALNANTPPEVRAQVAKTLAIYGDRLGIWDRQTQSDTRPASIQVILQSFAGHVAVVPHRVGTTETIVEGESRLLSPVIHNPPTAG